MKTIYLAVDEIAHGTHEIDPALDLLAEIQRKIPNAKTILARDSNSPVSDGELIVIHTSEHDQILAARQVEREAEAKRRQATQA